MTNHTALPEWAALAAHAGRMRAVHLRELFDADPARHAALHVEALDLHYDYSRQRVTGETLARLYALARACSLEARIAALFAGEAVNGTERRAAMHMALRHRGDTPMRVGGKDVMPEVRAGLAHMRAFVEGVGNGSIVGHTRARFTEVVNIGIGGSDLGIVMATEALARFRNRAIRLHCVSNVDGVELADTLERIDPARTLFVVCSKTFTTQETLSNAQAAREWLQGELGAQAIPAHFVAVSTNAQAMDAFGIAADRRFTMWDWVGGRYSLWSAVGLSIALALGFGPFEQLLEGAGAMDRHFAETPLEANLPVIAGVLGVWNRNFLGFDSLAILPYDRRLHRFAAYLQQLEMESNGKSVTRDGHPVACETGPVLWGEPGSNAQHSFFQLLHQGTARVALDFVVPVNGSSIYARQQRLALANCLGQAEAFAFGQDADRVRAQMQAAGTAAAEIERLLPHRIHAGNRPSTVLMMPRLEPRTLGSLIALYEHKVFVQSVLWDINPFDQWGVELGKVLATAMLPAVEQPASVPLPAHLAAVLARASAWRNT